VILLGVQQHTLQNLRELMLAEPLILLLLLSLLLLATVLQVVDVLVVCRKFLVDLLGWQSRVIRKLL
jgi:hypothetical protein